MVKLGIRILGWLLAAAVAALLVAAVVIPRVMGWAPLSVASGSMEPTFSVGSLIVVRPIDANDAVEPGDIVAFMPKPDDPTLVTHRVVSVERAGDGTESFTTKGDANNSPDPGVITRTQLRGEYLYGLPYLGWVATALPVPVRLIGITVIGLTLLAYAVWQGIALVRSGPKSQGVRAEADPGD